VKIKWQELPITKISLHNFKITSYLQAAITSVIPHPENFVKAKEK